MAQARSKHQTSRPRLFFYFVIIALILFIISLSVRNAFWENEKAISSVLLNYQLLKHTKAAIINLTRSGKIVEQIENTYWGIAELEAESETFRFQFNEVAHELQREQLSEDDSISIEKFSRTGTSFYNTLQTLFPLKNKLLQYHINIDGKFELFHNILYKQEINCLNLLHKLEIIRSDTSLKDVLVDNPKCRYCEAIADYNGQNPAIGKQLKLLLRLLEEFYITFNHADSTSPASKRSSTNLHQLFDSLQTTFRELDQTLQEPYAETLLEFGQQKLKLELSYEEALDTITFFEDYLEYVSLEQSSAAMENTTDNSRFTIFAMTLAGTIFSLAIGYYVSHRVKIVFNQMEEANKKLQIEIKRNEKIRKDLQKSEERYQRSALGSNDGLWDLDLEHDSIYFSDRWKSMLGMPAKTSISTLSEWYNRTHPEDLYLLKSSLQEHIDNKTNSISIEHRLMHNDGRYRWMLCRGIGQKNTEDTIVRIAGSLTDISEQKAVEERLIHDAFHDEMTGLPNKALFMEHLRKAYIRTNRNKDFLFAVMVLDIDRFKIISDSFGHETGDTLLVDIARRLRQILRKDDEICRFGNIATIARFKGDEFIILLDGIKKISDVTRVAERIRQTFREPFTLKDQQIFITFSMGIAASTSEYTNQDDLIRDADNAMHKAQALGGNCHRIFDTKMHQQAISLLTMESDLRKAVDKEQFTLHYQPIISLLQGNIIGFEALIRWIHPTRRMISPLQFIPLAEETGLILPIGEFVLREACKQISKWQKTLANPDLFVTVNVSAKQFSQKNLVSFIEEAVKNAAITPMALKLEITESVIMEDADKAKKIISAMKSLGTQIYLDDFGTGYSSLNHLHSFPFDCLKIDRSFIMNLDDHKKENFAIIRTILSLADNLNMKVTAEGIETEKHLEILRILGCDFGQGYFFSKPLEPDAVTNILSLDKKW